VLRTAREDDRSAALAAACEALGDDELDRLLAEGRAMSVDEAIAYALDEGER
jgi:hypothetical protein